MKDRRKTDIDRMVMGSRYLNAISREDMAKSPYTEMERQEHLRKISEQAKALESLQETVRSLQATIERLSSDSMRNRERMERALSEIGDELKAERERSKALERELEKYRDRNARSDRERYGKKSRRGRDLGGDGGGKTRVREKDEYDGGVENPGGNACPPPDGASPDAGKVSETPVKERGPRGPYNRMDAACTEVIESSFDAPEDWRLDHICYEDEYTRVSYIKRTRFQILVYRDGFGNMHRIFNPKNPGEKRRPGCNVICGTHCTPEFLASLAVGRTLVCTPVYRGMHLLRTEKMSVCAQTVCNWLHRGASLLNCLSDSLKKLLLKSGTVLHIDETWAKVRIYTGGAANGKYFTKYVWAMVNKATGVAYFLYDNDGNDSRGRRPIQKFMEGFTGCIQTDAYAVYKFFSQTDGANRHALCWAHVRSKFFDAAKIAKDKDAEWFVSQINYLYGVETEMRALNLDADGIKERRNRDDVLECLRRMFDRAVSLFGKAGSHLSDLMTRALKYMINGRAKLLTFLGDGRCDIDNLAAERTIRPFTVERKNVGAFGSEAGLKDACVYHSFLETCKMRGVSFYDFLVALFRKLMRYDPNGDTPPDMDFDTMLPGVLKLETA